MAGLTNPPPPPGTLPPEAPGVSGSPGSLVGPPASAEDPGAHPSPTARHPRFRGLREVGSGIAAVGVKELRGRMRGKRAFVILTVHLLLVAGFAWMVETLAERSYSGGFGTTLSATAEIGRTLFIAIMFLLTLITLVLAPASTSGAISLEREKQTLDLLATTPIPSLAIVLGKLVSALSWIVLLLLASIPVVALVFTFGGVSPGDVVKGYLVLLGTAIVYGSIGLFVSALTKRTQAATVINLVVVIFLTAGTTFLFVFWTAMAGSRGFLPDAGRGDDNPVAALAKRPPEALMWFNPFLAQVDVMCGTETGFGASCQIVAAVTDQEAMFDGNVADDFGVGRDSYWPRSVAAMLVTAMVLVLLSVQLVSPTRRWRLRRERTAREPVGGPA